MNKDIVKDEPWNLVGIEVEYVDVVPQKISPLTNFLSKHGFQITHDASVESPTSMLDHLPVKGKTIDPTINKMFIRRGTIGGELVSPILDTSNITWVEVFDDIFSMLKQHGERAGTNRGSIHIHVNMPRDLTKPARGNNRHSVGILRRAWMLAGYFEYFFYKIGSFGRPQRGKNMDYIYYRPITGNGPPVVDTGNGNYRPALIFNEVLESKGYREFMVRCGDIWNAENRYHPCRYMWFNLYNLVHAERPHLEFRVFNKTLRWDYLWMAVELCKAFVKTCYIKETKDIRKFVKGQVFGLTNTHKDLRETIFESAVNYFDIKDEAILSLLHRVYYTSPEPEYIDDRVWTHLRSRSHPFRHGDFQEYWPERLTDRQMKTVRTPTFIDIHKLKKMGETIFPEEML
jgi:hypothetical protein